MSWGHSQVVIVSIKFEERLRYADIVLIYGVTIRHTTCHRKSHLSFFRKALRTSRVRSSICRPSSLVFFVIPSRSSNVSANDKQISSMCLIAFSSSPSYVGKGKPSSPDFFFFLLIVQSYQIEYAHVCVRLLAYVPNGLSRLRDLDLFV